MNMVRMFWFVYTAAVVIVTPLFVNWVLDVVQSVTFFVGGR